MKMKGQIGLGRFVVMMAILSCWVAGCGFRPQPARGVKHIIWSRSEAGKEHHPGIDDADINIFTWNDGAAFVVWTDGTSTSRGTSPRQPSDPRGSARYDGKVGDLNIECVTLDGLTGKLKIGASSYELAQGRLFLVGAEETTPRICQMSLTKLDLKPDGNQSDEQMTLEYLRALADTDPEIRAFFLKEDPQ